MGFPRHPQQQQHRGVAYPADQDSPPRPQKPQQLRQLVLPLIIESNMSELWELRARQLQRFHAHDSFSAEAAGVTNSHLRRAKLLAPDSSKKTPEEEDWPENWATREKSLKTLLSKKRWLALPDDGSQISKNQARSVSDSEHEVEDEDQDEQDQQDQPPLSKPQSLKPRAQQLSEQPTQLPSSSARMVDIKASSMRQSSGSRQAPTSNQALLVQSAAPSRTMPGAFISPGAEPQNEDHASRQEGSSLKKNTGGEQPKIAAAQDAKRDDLSMEDLRKCLQVLQREKRKKYESF